MIHSARMLVMGRRVSSLAPSSLFFPSLSSSFFNSETQRKERLFSSSTSAFEEEQPGYDQEDDQELWEAIKKDGRLYAHQDELPRLPVPDIKDSCDRYLRALEPLLPAELMEETKQMTQHFLEEKAPTLQRDLQKLEKENSKGSWLSGYWEDKYLSNRGPRMLDVNRFWLLSPFEGHRDPIQVLASTIRSTASFHHLVRTGGLSPDKSDGVPLCSHQYERFLASTAIPNQGKDFHVSTPESNHIILNVAGKMFFFLVITPAGNVIPQELCEKAIKKCLKEAGQMMNQQGEDDGSSGMVPFFTAGNRDNWAQVRKELSMSNSSQLQALDSAIAVFNFIDCSGENTLESCMTALAPPYGWFDKTQFNVMQNGQVSINMEHAAVDGHTLLTYIKHLRSEFEFGVGSGELGRDNGPSVTDADFESFVKHAKPYHLEWDVAMLPRFQERAQQAQQSWGEEVRKLDASVIDFPDFGADLIKSKKISPDAFMQAAFQLAHFRWTCGEVASTYESVSMKKYQRGRTETGRPLTPELKKFCEDMEDVLLPAEKQAEALRVAAAAHSQQIASCAAGQGFDRHLWVLKHIMEERIQRLDNEEVHPFFYDTGYEYLNQHNLSTSTCSVDGVESFGFGPAHDHGFGIGYAAESEKLKVFVAAKNGDRATVLGAHISKAFKDMKAILEAEEKVKEGSKEGKEEENKKEDEAVEVAETEAVGNY